MHHIIPLKSLFNFKRRQDSSRETVPEEKRSDSTLALFSFSSGDLDLFMMSLLQIQSKFSG